MIQELINIEKLFQKINEQNITNLTIDDECEEYFGYNFRLKKLKIKFRKSKITPKKIGQFVTLWKRNSEKRTEPFNDSDHFDFYIFQSEQGKKMVYLFSQKICL